MYNRILLPAVLKESVLVSGMKTKETRPQANRILIASLMVALYCPVATVSLAQEFLTAAEKSALEKEKKIDNRIKVYQAASARLSKLMQGALQEHDFARLEQGSENWVKLLSASLEDIEENVNRKKKSRALINFEIHLRRTILDMRSFKFKLPADQQNQFDSWLDRAEEAHKKMVGILFPG